MNTKKQSMQRRMFFCSCLGVFLLLLSVSCKKHDGDNNGNGSGNGPDPTTVTPYYVTGTVKDPSGHPIAGANIEVHNAVYVSSISTKTDNNGRYRVKVPEGSWRVIGNVAKNYNGVTFCLRLKPTGSVTFAASEGAVVNMTFDPSGAEQNPDGTTLHFGGILNIEISPLGLTPGVQYDVTTTLTPDGPLINGNPGEVVTLKDQVLFDGSRINYKWWGIAIGKYKATCVFHGNDGSTFNRTVTVESENSSFYRTNTVMFDGGSLGCSSDYYVGIELRP